MTRLRSPAQRAPQNVDQALVLLDRYAQISAELDAVEANRQRELAATNGVADLLAVPIIAELKEIAKQLKPWWAASIDELTGGKRKSIELGGCTIGYRISPPKVVHTWPKDGDAAEALRSTTYADQAVRVTYALDKPAILKLLEREAEQATDADVETLASLGFEAKQSEEFFVDRIIAGATATIAH